VRADYGRIAGRILVVEDNAAVRRSVVRQIESFGYKVESAASAGEALYILRSDQDFDMVFSDVVMPGEMDGVDLARIVQRDYPGMRVVLTSGYPDYEEANHNCEFLPKPYRRDALRALLSRCLNPA